MSPSNAFPFLTDEEILELVKPLTQPAAILRWLRNNGFENVRVKPNGMPLIGRAYFDQVTGGATIPRSPVDLPRAVPNREAFLARYGNQANAARKAQRAAERESKKLLASIAKVQKR